MLRGPGWGERVEEAERTNYMYHLGGRSMENLREAEKTRPIVPRAEGRVA